MPFPWKKKTKKNGVSRISNFVADLQSPKRGGSLVVETGFPTSLIDLFVKNRSRFKKPKSKNPVRREIPDPPPSAAATPAQPPKSTNREVCRRPAVAEARYPEAPTGSDDSDPNRVIAALAKMLVVFVVILSVNKLTLGITISAFVLLFIEFAGKRFVSCLKPCENANAAFKSLAGRVFSRCNFFRNPSSEGNSVNSSSDEIEIVETGSRCDESELIRSSTMEEEKEEEEECEMISSVKTKRSGKLKSKIVKKLVPKKLRSLKKDKEGIKEKKMRRASSSCSEVLSSEIGEEEDDDEKVDCGIMNQEVCEEGDYEIDDHQNEHEQEKMKMKMKSIDSESGCVMLILITLVGLVEGRFLALILTITWIFMLKMLKSRERSVRSLNVPLFFKGSKQILS